MNNLNKLENIIYYSFIIFIVFFSLINLVNAFSGNGDGSEINPYLITNCSLLQEINLNLTAYYSVINNINCSETINWNSNEGFNPIGNIAVDNYLGCFKGNFQGNNYKIYDLFINRNQHTNDCVGLFGCVSDNGIINNVGIIKANITQNTGGVGTGVLVGRFSGGLVNNSYSNGYIYSYNGGMIGNMYAGSILSNSYSDLNIYSINGEAGGLVSQLNQDAIILNSYSKSHIYGINNYDNWYGGLIGAMTGEIYNSYSLSLIFNSNHGGGLFGYIENSSGTNYGFNMYNTYFDKEFTNLNGSSYYYWDDNDEIINWGSEYGKITNQMKNISTYENWDFINTWELCDEINEGYPSLIGVDEDCLIINLPTNVIIENPVCNSSFTIQNSENTSIYFNWTNSIDLENESILYNLYIYNGLNILIFENLTNNFYNHSFRYLTPDNYYTKVYSCDSLNCSISLSNCSFNICQNEYNLSLKPCIDGLTIKEYYDVNDCNEQYDLPLDNGSYVLCTSQPTQINGTITATLNTTSILNTFTEMDAIFLIIIIITLYFPFYMNKDEWLWLYILSGIFLAGYTLFLSSKFLILFPNFTYYTYALSIFLYLISLSLCIIGTINFLKILPMNNKKK